MTGGELHVYSVNQVDCDSQLALLSTNQVGALPSSLANHKQPGLLGYIPDEGIDLTPWKTMFKGVLVVMLKPD